MESMFYITSLLNHIIRYPGRVSMWVTFNTPASQCIFVVRSYLCMFVRSFGSLNTSMENHVSSRIWLGLMEPFCRNVWWINRAPWSYLSSMLSSSVPSSSLLVVSASPNRNYSMFASNLSSSRLVLASSGSSILRKWKSGTPSDRSLGVLLSTSVSNYMM